MTYGFNGYWDIERYKGCSLNCPDLHVEAIFDCLNFVGIPGMQGVLQQKCIDKLLISAIPVFAILCFGDARF